MGVNVRQLLPPIFIRILKRIGPEHWRHTFKGQFASWNDCVNSLPYSSDYSSEASDQIVSKAFWELDEPRQMQAFSCKAPAKGRDVLIQTILSILTMKGRVTLVDIGGGNNPVLFRLSKTARKMVDAIVLDRQALIKKITSAAPARQSKSLKLVSRFDELSKPKGVGIAYFGSSLQYTMQNDIQAILGLGYELIVIADAPMTSFDKNIWVHQINKKSLVFPCCFISKPMLQKMALEAGYSLIFESVLPTEDRISHRDIDPTKISYETLIFASKG